MINVVLVKKKDTATRVLCGVVRGGAIYLPLRTLMSMLQKEGSRNLRSSQPNAKNVAQRQILNIDIVRLAN